MTNTRQCVNKVSRCFTLLSNFTCQNFCDCLFVNVHRHYHSWMSDYFRLQFEGVLFTGNFTRHSTSWLEMLFFAIRDSASVRINPKWSCWLSGCLKETENKGICQISGINGGCLQESVWNSISLRDKTVI